MRTRSGDGRCRGQREQAVQPLQSMSSGGKRCSGGGRRDRDKDDDDDDDEEEEDDKPKKKKKKKKSADEKVKVSALRVLSFRSVVDVLCGRFLCR